MNVMRLQPYFLLALLGGAVVLAFFILKPFLAPLVLAAVCAAVFYPVYTLILKKIGSKRTSIAALLTVLLSATLVLVPLGFLSVSIAREAEQLYLSLADGSGKAYLNSALVYADQLLQSYAPGSQGVADTISTNIDSYAKSGLTWLIGYLGSVFSSVAVLLLKLFIFFIALYYLLRDGVALKRKLIQLSPLADIDDKTIVDRLSRSVNSTVKGTLTIAMIQGVLTAIGFMVCGVPNAVLWGSVAAIAALIPGFGTALVLVPAIFFLFISGHPFAGAGLLVWGVLAVGLIDNLLGPKLIGHGSGLHPLLVLLSVLGGISFFGPLGIFLGPLTLSFLFAVISIYTESTTSIA